MLRIHSDQGGEGGAVDAAVYEAFYAAGRGVGSLGPAREQTRQALHFGRDDRPVPHPSMTGRRASQSSWAPDRAGGATCEPWCAGRCGIDRLRRQVYQAAGDRCEICGGRGTDHPVEAHEVWAYDDTTLVQRLLRMTALCRACREVKVKHYGRTSSSAGAGRHWPTSPRSTAGASGRHAATPPRPAGSGRRAVSIPGSWTSAGSAPTSKPSCSRR